MGIARLFHGESDQGPRGIESQHKNLVLRKFHSLIKLEFVSAVCVSTLNLVIALSSLSHPPHPHAELIPRPLPSLKHDSNTQNNFSQNTHLHFESKPQEEGGPALTMEERLELAAELRAEYVDVMHDTIATITVRRERRIFLPNHFLFFRKFCFFRFKNGPFVLFVGGGKLLQIRILCAHDLVLVLFW